MYDNNMIMSLKQKKGKFEPRIKLNHNIYKGTRFKEKSILDAKTHFKQTETFLNTHFTSCHPPNFKKGFVKGEA